MEGAWLSMPRVNACGTTRHPHAYSDRCETAARELVVSPPRRPSRTGFPRARRAEGDPAGQRGRASALQADEVEWPRALAACVLVMVVWTVVATWAYAEPRRRTLPLLVTDLVVAGGAPARDAVRDRAGQRERARFLGDRRARRLGIRYRTVGGLVAGIGSPRRPTWCARTRSVGLRQRLPAPPRWHDHGYVCATP